jgi:peptidoglycan/LPS O-acetylase OafA/YrhL
MTGGAAISLRSDRAVATLGQRLDACGGIAPGFNTIRLAAALAVLVSHAFDLAPTAAWPEPIRQFSGLQTNLAGSAVYMFFFISGFLVTASYQKSQTIQEYARKRASRILPALFVVVFLAAFVLGPIVTTLPLSHYFSDARFYSYLLNALTIGRDSLPGVFDHLPSNGVNGSLWTLRYELICYALVVLAGACGLLERRRLLLVLAVPVVALGWWAKGKSLYVFEPLDVEFAYILRFVGYFIVGMAFWVFRYRIILDWKFAAVAALLSVIFLRFGLYHLFFPLLGGYLVAFFAMQPRLGFAASSRHDYSYGFYVYAYPIQQLVVGFAPAEPVWWTNVLWSVPLTMICAILSWHLVEKPALSFFRSSKFDHTPNAENRFRTSGRRMSQDVHHAR